jgi:type I restriction enzyme M protein
MAEQNASAIVDKVWSQCAVLRDDGVGYGDYLEQLTYLIFLKMADEYSKPPYSRSLGIPAEFAWDKLAVLAGAELEKQYKDTLEQLGGAGGTLGNIFSGAQNKISDPAKLKRIVTMIGAENWVSMSADVKGDIYEGLLEKNAAYTKSGAGQYFTPRALIRAMVECLRPQPGKTIVDRLAELVDSSLPRMII